MRHDKQNGFTVIMIVLILGVVSLSASVVFAKISIDNAAMDNSRNDAWEVRQNVRGCMDELLIWLAGDSAYTTSSIVTGSATCGVVLTSPTPTTRNATITDFIGNVYYGLNVDFQVDPIVVTSVVESLN
ncbi:hypothetical protein HQ524_02170 [Candidatus Uhrbacteria bacterium]|nr:hypothetical protein [Candidatus Uhrbacteria bacterium]